MALQIAPIKASRRKILPGLNEPHYKQTSPSRAKVRTASGRYELVSAAKARKVSRQKARRQVASARIPEYVPDMVRGQQLKKGIENLALASDDITEKQLAKIRAMDPAKLDAMYQRNDLIFEVYFQYSNSENGELSNKSRDADFLIELYERYYGEIRL